MSVILTAQKVNFKNILYYPDIEINTGQCTFFSGKSGAGKSTLLKLFNGTLSPTEGTILYNGKSIEDMDTVALRREVLLVSQSLYLFDISISENFREYYAYRNLTMPEACEIQKYLSICCADFPLETLCSSMSGGERQRIYTAIYLSFMPRVLMLDEPTSALDRQTGFSFMENITSYCKKTGITLLIISHDTALTEQFAERKIIIMQRR